MSLLDFATDRQRIRLTTKPTPPGSGRRKATVLYTCWKNMRRRVVGQSGCAPSYLRKGVSVCREWGSFYTFRRWALANGFRKGLTIDRIDSNGDYCPENCQWITLEENSGKDCRGEKHHAARHSDSTVERVRRAVKAVVSRAQIVRTIGVSQSTISRWVRGKGRVVE